MIHRLRAGLLACPLLFFSGCGSIGDPLPPLANIPGHITDLAAVQRGSNLIVQFTVPTLTTERMPIKAPLKLDLRVGTSTGDSFNSDRWAELAKSIPETPVGKGNARYEIPAAEWAGRQVTIGVRAIGANGKDSGWSNFANLHVVAAPQKPVVVVAENVPEGVRLSWQPGSGPGEFRIFRRTADEKSFSLLATIAQPPWIDPQTEYGKRYTYIVQRVVKTGDTQQAESETSDETALTPEDKFPPAAPTGLRAAPALQSIELSWDRNAEADLNAYRVYRAEGTGDFAKLADVGLIPAYSDRAIESGKPYRYLVTAIDKAGNESSRSAPVEAAVAR